MGVRCCAHWVQSRLRGGSQPGFCLHGSPSLWLPKPGPATQAWAGPPARGPSLVPRPTAQSPSFLRVRGPTAAHSVLASCSQSCPWQSTSSPPLDHCPRLGHPPTFFCLGHPQQMGSRALSSPLPRGQRGPGRAGSSEHGCGTRPRPGHSSWPHAPLQAPGHQLPSLRAEFLACL